jgi:hypothetical protein
MKPPIVFTGFLFSLVLLLNACKKESIITSKDARIELSADTLFFDTVFTSTGSITQGIKIYNNNNQKLIIDRVRIGGGTTSSFTMNVDGTPGNDLSGFAIESGDSLYIYVTVTINPNSDLLPFIVRDSILIGFNGNEKKLQLEAFGQNANFLRNNLLTGSNTWTPELPYVILGGLQVDTNALLTIEKGTRVYLHADAPFIVDGTLIVNGTKADSVIFTGDRLDKDYRDLPASWPGIYFRQTSVNNVLTNTIIKNAYQGLVADQPASNGAPKLTLRECIIDNSYEAGLSGLSSSINAENCLIKNCGINILLIRGGDYNFTHCTVAAYSNLYIPHKNPVAYINNWDSTNNTLFTFNLNANFVNNIFWSDDGTSVENEVVVSKKGTNVFEVVMNNNIYKAIAEPSFTTLSNNLRNQDPLFDSVNVSAGYYDFHIDRYPSPAINAGIPTNIQKDLDGKTRSLPPDIGCYEKN